VHVWQIFLRHEGEIEAARRELEAGVPFEEAARRRFPNVPASAGAFWDVGWVRLAQAPEAWRDELAKLEPGATSGVLRGPKNRFWILKLVGRRENPALTFEAVKPAVVEAVRAEKIEARRAEKERELRARAKVEITHGVRPGA
jgi:parvulin-like peptidyl-prolyl isomerase